MQHINVSREPRIEKPLLLAAWPGIGNVALQTAEYIRDKLNAKEFADIEPSELFTPIGVMVQDSVVQIPEFPRNRFYHWKNKRGKNDLIIFIAEAQPDHKQHDLTFIILDFAKKLGVTRVYTTAAVVVQHQITKSRVLGAATSHKLTNELRRHGVVLPGDFQIRGLNGLLLGAAKMRRMEGLCLLGETPHYAAEIANPIPSHAILQVLTRMLSIDIDLADMARAADEMAEEIKNMARDAMTEYISQYTRPIWERQEETRGHE